MTDEQNARAKPSSSNSMRGTGKVLMVIGVILGVCGIGWAIGYYTTNQWFDLGESFMFLADLTYWNLVAVGSSLCCGLVVGLTGLILYLVGRAKRT